MIEFVDLQLSNFGPFAEARLDLYRRGLVLIRGNNCDTTAADSNGSGKTSLFRALCWALFGDTIEGDRMEEIIRQGAAACEVAVRFRDEDHEYRVVRHRGKGPSLDLFDGETRVSGATIKDTQSRIQSVLGLDFRTFRNTVLYGQGDVNRFADPRTSDADRKAVLKRVLRLEVLEAAQKELIDRRKVLAKASDTLSQRVQIVQARMVELDTQRAEERLHALMAKSEDIGKKTLKRQKLERLQREIGEVLESYGDTRAELERLREKQRKLDQEAQRLSAEFRVVHRECENLRVRLSELNAGRCPTCSTPTDSPHVLRFVDELKDKLAAEELRLTETARRQKEAELAVTFAEQEIKKRREELADEKDWLHRRLLVSGELKEIEALERESKDLETWIAQSRVDVQRLKTRRSELEAEAAYAQKSLSQTKAEEEHVAFWVEGFGNQGLVSHILDGIVPELTERANHYLSILSDGDLTLRFDTETELKSGGIRDKFSVLVDVEGVLGVRPSTGQLKKVTLATDLALMDLVAAREHAAIDLLLLDEVLDGLDASGRARVVDLLLTLRQTRSSIFVISHDPGLAELFEHVITVVKQDRVASLEAAA